MTGSLEHRIAAAPISWGACEVPGWGWQQDPATVLTQMRELGLAATEFGPDGFLPDDPAAKAKTLTDNGLQAVGGFVPVILHVPDHDPVPDVAKALEGFAAAGAGSLVLAAATGQDGYDARPVLDEAGWACLLANLDHLEDVDASWAARVQTGEVAYTDAVRQGMFRPLGQGDADIRAIVRSLESRGYLGWYVLEQDTILTDEPAVGDEGPLADVRTSVDHLKTVAEELSRG